MIAIRIRAPGLLAALLALVAATATERARSPHVAATRTLTIVPAQGSAPKLVAYRAEGATQWSVLAATSRGYVVTSPARRYTVVVACPGFDDLELIQFFHLAAEDAETVPVDCRDDSGRRLTVPVEFVDPAEQLWVGSQHAGVWTDGNGNIVDRRNQVTLYPGLYDWLAMSKKPFRIALSHDVPPSPALRKIDLRAGAPVEKIRVRVPGADWIEVMFRSRNGTRFSGLGEPEPGVFDIVPRGIRAAGDVDVVIGERSFHDAGRVVLVAKAFPNPPYTVELALPAASPTSRLVEGGVNWRGAADVDLVSIELGDDTQRWEVTASARWLAGKTVYKPIDPGSIPGWTWRRTVRRALWIAWQWTDDPTHMPFDPFAPPAGVTFARIAEPPR